MTVTQDLHPRPTMRAHAPRQEKTRAPTTGMSTIRMPMSRILGSHRMCLRCAKRFRLNDMESFKEHQCTAIPDGNPGRHRSSRSLRQRSGRSRSNSRDSSRPRGRRHRSPSSSRSRSRSRSDSRDSSRPRARRHREPGEVFNATQILMTAPGVSHYSGLALSSRIGPTERFPRPRSLANYFGLTPGCRNTGKANDRFGALLVMSHSQRSRSEAGD